MPPAAFLHPQNAPKSLAARASPRPHYGSLQRSHRPHNWIKGATSKGGEKGGEGKWRKGQVTGGEARDFGPSQCWKQIDALADHCCKVSTHEGGLVTTNQNTMLAVAADGADGRQPWRQTSHG